VRKLILVGLAMLAVATGPMQAGAHSTRQASPSITLVSVKELPGRIVRVEVRITAWKMIPSKVGKKPNSATGGHWHIFVNGKYNNLSANATTGRTVKLRRGRYAIRAELAYNDHSELTPPARSRTLTIKVT